MSSRWERIAITSCLFTISYLLHSNWSGWAISRKSSATLTAADNNNNNNVSLSNNNDDSSLIHIFYNLYVNNSADAHRVLGIFHEQTSMLNSQLHDINITVNSIGYKLNYFPNALLHNHKHYQEGGEDVTLRSLWEYCRAANPSHDSKVVYLHSKGSFHPNESNDNLRRFLTEGALSQECAHLPTECNVCSSRMSPHPHPHTSGNMWLARCNYITKLRDPYAFIRKVAIERMMLDLSLIFGGYSLFCIMPKYNALFPIHHTLPIHHISTFLLERKEQLDTPTLNSTIIRGDVA